MIADTMQYIAAGVFPAMHILLPSKMKNKAADTLSLAIALQETRLLYRQQIGGPANGLWQFEKGGGVRGVLEHSATKVHIQDVLRTLNYDFAPLTSYEAIINNDVLAACYARLFLWTHPKALPSIDDSQAMYRYYLDVWRPGTPREGSWVPLYHQAKECINGRAAYY